MLYFSKLKIIIIYFIIIFLSFFSFVNFAQISDNPFFSKKINLGLDLQGGSYLLLEVDSVPIIKQRMQQKLLNLRKALKSEKIKYKSLKLQNETINFQLSENDVQRFEDFFLNKENSINAYYDRYRSYEMDYSITTGNRLTITYSKAARATIGFIVDPGEYSPATDLLTNGRSGLFFISFQSFTDIP